MAEVEIGDLQRKILDIVSYLDSFCQENGIKYYLMGGSALGAMRHHGFIPWDDDLDVFMTYHNYMKFVEIAKKRLDTIHYYLQEENTKEWPMFFTKLRMNGTTFIEKDTMTRQMHKGVFVDIMCLNNVSNNCLYRYFQYLSARLLTAQTLSVRGYQAKGIKKLAIMVSAILVRGRFKEFLIRFVRSLNNRSTEYVGHFFGKASFSKTCFPLRWLGEMRYVPFESILLPVPSEAEKYLTLRFGDWNRMPDKKTLAEYPIHALYVDLEKDWSEYVDG